MPTYNGLTADSVLRDVSPPPPPPAFMGGVKKFHQNYNFDRRLGSPELPHLQPDTDIKKGIKATGAYMAVRGRKNSKRRCDIDDFVTKRFGLKEPIIKKFFNFRSMDSFLIDHTYDAFVLKTHSKGPRISCRHTFRTLQRTSPK
ncbi:hypothetical protein Zmor_008154 [Zophobas morio]|uniref:Uncharacterized protein n=1 Tax=Zophobas morio TaxID=2755281 RepID=A0AA38MQJ1_9CUCU|nr:hypothetical protein Zmor_008154 [Zophobas morio]